MDRGALNHQSGVNMIKINKIDVDKFNKIINIVRENPELGKNTYRVKTLWRGGTKSQTKIRDFTVNSDVPETLTGSNSGPTPPELTLASYGACLAEGYAVHASLLGIEIEDMEVEVEGDTDARGYFGLSEDKTGYQDIRAKVHLKTNAKEEELQKLHEHVLKTSPVGNTLFKSIKVTSEFDRNVTHEPISLSKFNTIKKFRLNKLLPFIMFFLVIIAYLLYFESTFVVPASAEEGEKCGFDPADFKGGRVQVDSWFLGTDWFTGPDWVWLVSFYRTKEYLLAIAFGLAIAYIAYSLIVYMRIRAARIAGTSAGVGVLGGSLLATSCVVAGCLSTVIGVTLLGVGAGFTLGIPKELVAANTFLFISLGTIWLRRKEEKVIKYGC